MGDNKRSVGRWETLVAGLGLPDKDTRGSRKERRHTETTSIGDSAMDRNTQSEVAEVRTERVCARAVKTHGAKKTH